MSNSRKASLLFIVFSLFMMACGAATSALDAPIQTTGTQLGLGDPGPFVVGSDGQAHKLPEWVAGCANHPLYTDPESPSWGSEIEFCKDTGEDLMILDAVLALTWASPLPGDEMIVGVIWAGDKVAKIVVLAAAATAAGHAAATIQIRHSDPQHNPNLPGTTAHNNVLRLVTVWLGITTTGGNPNDNFRCKILKAGGAVIKGVIWMADQSAPYGGGFLAWFKIGATKNWGGSYYQSPEDFGRGPKLGPAQSYEDISCDDPDFKPPLQFAQ